MSLSYYAPRFDAYGHLIVHRDPCSIGTIVKSDVPPFDMPCPLEAQTTVALHAVADLPSGPTVSLPFCFIHAQMLEEGGAGFSVD